MNSDDTRRLATYVALALDRRDEGITIGYCPKCDGYLELWGGYTHDNRVGIYIRCEHGDCDFMDIELCDCEILRFGWDK